MAKSEAVDNVQPMLRVIEGGKPPTDADWLRELPVGTVFLCRSKNMSKIVHSLEQYHLTWKATRSAGLFYNENDMAVSQCVDTQRFSNNMELIDILGRGMAQQQEETNGEDHSRTPGTVQDRSSD